MENKEQCGHCKKRMCKLFFVAILIGLVGWQWYLHHKMCKQASIINEYRKELDSVKNNFGNVLLEMDDKIKNRLSKKFHEKNRSFFDETFYNPYLLPPYLVGDFISLNNNYNVKKDGDKYIIEVIVAGFSKDNIKVSIDDDCLIVDAQFEEDNKSRKSLSKITLPKNIKENEISCTLENGILKVVIPSEKESPNEKDSSKVVKNLTIN